MSARLTALSIGLALVAALGAWLHLNVVPDIAWIAPHGGVYTGWAAIRAAWPVYATVGALLGLLGLIWGMLAGDTVRERDILARAAAAERERDNAQQEAAHERDRAQSAVDDAEASAQRAISADRAELKRLQDRARDEASEARGARTAADNEAARARSRVAELERELGRCQARLAGALRAMQRGEAETAELYAELANLRDEILP